MLTKMMSLAGRHKHFVIKTLPLFLSLLGLYCTNNHPNFQYIKFKDYHFERGYLKPFSKVQLLSVSGGKPCDGSNVYLYQFVVIDEATNDTMRILSPCELYDQTQTSTNATYIPIGNTLDSINNYLNNDSHNKAIDEDHLFVVVNSKHFTELRHYKTMVGFVGFK